jgi:hypothetical protein
MFIWPAKVCIVFESHPASRIASIEKSRILVEKRGGFRYRTAFLSIAKAPLRGYLAAFL